MLGLEVYTRGHGKEVERVTAWKLWGVLLGAPLAAALLVMGATHAIDDHAMLHGLVAITNQRMGDHDALAALQKQVEQATKETAAQVSAVEKKAADVQTNLDAYHRQMDTIAQTANGANEKAGQLWEQVQALRK